MAKNRTMQQKNAIARKRAMKQSRENRWNIMCQEYHEPNYAKKYAQSRYSTDYKDGKYTNDSDVVKKTYMAIDEEDIIFMCN